MTNKDKVNSVWIKLMYMITQLTDYNREYFIGQSNVSAYITNLCSE